MGGAGNPAAKLVLLGSGGPRVTPNFHKDTDALVLTEIVEFAMSLTTPAKGKEPFAGLPHLQAYKLVRATSLAELGHVQLASRYCEAISSSLSRSSPYITPAFVEQLRTFNERLTAAPQIDQSGSWMKGTVGKPTLNNIGNWLEGRFTKFITGDGENSPAPTMNSTFTPDPPAPAAAATSTTGPFSNYSTISTTSSPQQYPASLPGTTGPSINVPPPSRQMSGTSSLVSAYGPYKPVERSASAMEQRAPYGQSLYAPSVPRIASANAATTTFAQSFGQAMSPYAPATSANSSVHDLTTPTQSSSTSSTSISSGDTVTDAEQEANVQEVTWWGSSYENDMNGVTPTAPSFVKLNNTSDTGATESTDGFISLMDDTGFGGGAGFRQVSSPLHQQMNYNDRRDNGFDDEDDLGLGNSKPRSRRIDEGGSEGSDHDTRGDATAGASAKEAEKKSEPAAAEKSGKYLCFVGNGGIFHSMDGFIFLQLHQLLRAHGLVACGAEAILSLHLSGPTWASLSQRSIMIKNSSVGSIKR
jgi:COPII coat assembly protein SEC16